MMWGALKVSARLQPSRSACLHPWARSLATSTRTWVLADIPGRLSPGMRSISNISSKEIRKPFAPRFFSSFSTQRAPVQTRQSASTVTTEAAKEIPILATPAVGRWLLLSSTLLFAIIVVGGVTRLTESGLSITEWRPITGILPPLSHDEWIVEFMKYQATPEFKLMNQSMSLEDFKSIFYMEWGHRILGRLIGVVFVGPLVYFALRKKVSRPMALKLFGLGLLIGLQGALGWYMVKSGLEDSLMDTPGAVPRVSQYRLAAHLGAAFLLYAGMFGTGMAVIKDWKYSRGALWSGVTENALLTVQKSPLARSFKAKAWALTGLVFLTAMSGAFVAGLDAGLLYNEFPLMGGRIAPPSDELFSPAYAKSEDGSDLWWRNIFENPTTVQFDHRVLAISTYIATAALFAQTFRPALRAALPPLTRTAMAAAFAMANVQVVLGISTLLYLVPVPLAAAHQAGSVALLSAMIHLLITLRQPGAAARLLRKLNLKKAPVSNPPTPIPRAQLAEAPRTP